MRLFLVRHGQTEFNATGRFQGHLQVPLSDEGIGQAQRLRGRLTRLERTLPFDRVISSDLSRASQTADIVFGPDRIAAYTPQLRERGLGVIEGLSRSEVTARFPAFAEAWARDPSTVRSEGLEAFGDFLQRLTAGLPELRQLPQDSRVAWVTHGFAIRALLHALTGISLKDLWRLAITNTSLTEIELVGPRCKVMRVNDHAHLDPQ